MALEIVHHINTLLQKSPRFSDKEGNLFTQSILEAIENLDPELIRLLLNDEKTKEQFFISIEGVTVLNQNALIEFFTMNDYMKNSSYTAYTNKIGLIRKDNFIKKFDDTVLAWPYKDCVLEGGMSTEDAGKKEVFYNTILSKDEIDRLFEPKVLTNIKKFSTDGVSIPNEITMEDNLILKGNNLLALHSLKKRYVGQIKLIYIDPPYNTGNDGFKYNDKFNHSTWLTFMKNRLEVAKELLRDDGVIFISIDDDEAHYLKIICDEVFGRENFVANIVWQKKYGPANDAKWFSDSHDHIFVIARKKINWKPNLFTRNDKQLKDFKNPDNDERGLWRASDLSVKTPSDSCMYPIIGPDGSTYYPPKTRSWVISEEKYYELLQDNRIWFGVNGTARPMAKRFLSEVKDGITPETWWNRDFAGDNKIARYEIKALFPDSPFSTPKPEKLIQRIIELSTEEGDIVLDYHLGSGTTAAVAHKMNRRYIGIEQMDYIETIAVERLKKVVEGEQGGISKSVGWNGGGSFIYAELTQIDTFNDAEIGSLNANMHYLPIGEIDDEEYSIAEEEKRLNKQFYGIN